MYLSDQLAAMAKRGTTTNKSLIQKTYSCGIFQNYDQIEAKNSKVNNIAQ